MIRSLLKEIADRAIDETKTLKMIQSNFKLLKSQMNMNIYRQSQCLKHLHKKCTKHVISQSSNICVIFAIYTHCYFLLNQLYTGSVHECHFVNIQKINPENQKNFSLPAFQVFHFHSLNFGFTLFLTNIGSDHSLSLKIIWSPEL